MKNSLYLKDSNHNIVNHSQDVKYKWFLIGEPLTNFDLVILLNFITDM